MLLLAADGYLHQMSVRRLHRYVGELEVRGNRRDWAQRFRWRHWCLVQEASGCRTLTLLERLRNVEARTASAH